MSDLPGSRDLPTQVKAMLSRITLARAAPAYLELSAEGELHAWGGELVALGIAATHPGQAVGELVPALEGMFPLPEAMDIPAVEMPSGRHADVHLEPTENGVCAVFLDVTEDVHQRRLLQQRGVDLGILAKQLERRNAFITRTFGRYLSDDVVERILDDPRGLSLGGELRTVTVLMNDLRGFTSMCERLRPAEVVALLNRYLECMTAVILEHEGTIDEFIGDAILVIFGAPLARPDDARRAVACALSMMLAMDEFSAWCLERGLPQLEMGIGLNTGDVIVGNIGSERRLKYGIVGATVNLTSRIESYTVGGQILASARTVADAGPGVLVRGQLEVSPKGVATPITVHDITGLEAPDGGPALRLPERAERFVDLEPPLQARLTVVRGKDLDGPQRGARCQCVSRAGALLVADVGPPADRTDVRLELLGERGQTIPGDLYGKVMVHPRASGERFYVRFTSIPPLVEASLAKLLG